MNHKLVVIIMSIIMIIGIIVGLGYMVYNGFNNEMSKVKNPELWTNVVEEEAEEPYQVIEEESEPQKPEVEIIYTDVESLGGGIMNLIYHLERKGIVFKRIEIVRYFRNEADEIDLDMKLYVVHNGIDLIFNVDNDTYTVESFMDDVDDVEGKINLMVETND